jgi:preprotein translocase subunit SecG
VWTTLLNVLLVICSLLLIFLVLIQRGKGGGLAGAFGGAGGSSAFGTKAGDVFTKVTMYVAGIWILISMFLVLLVNQGRTSAWVGGSRSASEKVAPRGTSKAKGTTGSDALPKPAPEVEPAPPGTEPSPPSSSKKPVQPLNPGDPLLPLPPPIKNP